MNISFIDTKDNPPIPMTTSPITSSQLPSPKGKFIVGHLPQFKADNKHQVMERWVEEVGDLFTISLLGKKFIVSAKPEINKEILRLRPGKFRRFDKIEEILKEMGILGVFNAEGEAWRKHRLITMQALNRQNVEGFFPTISKVADRLWTKWNAMAQAGETIDVQKEMMRYTVDITTEIAFGYPMNTLEKGEDVIQTHLEKIFPMINARITAPLPLWRLIKSKKDKAFDTAMVEIKSTVHQLIEEGKKRLVEHPEIKDHPNNFLEALLVQQANEGTFSDDEVFGNVFTMLLAGEDTTSNSISWSLYYLAQNPAIVDKIRQEANDIYSNSHTPSTYEEASALTYTDAVVQESLRIKPVTPNLYMTALEDVEIEGYLFQKGETIMMQNKVAQTHPDNFIRPDEFMPERWISSGCPMHGGAHSPDMIRTFGGGSRFCPGKGLAMSELVITLSTICKNFDLELAVRPEEVKEVFAFSMFPENLLIKLKAV
ncbi:hypothetical protein BGP76_12760 [Reichenbachiella sp. MSK19-1]|nr:hypothetical protein BGP76_12760 [Reichenbachiella sp. MSK19-1]